MSCLLIRPASDRAIYDFCARLSPRRAGHPTVLPPFYLRRKCGSSYLNTQFLSNWRNMEICLDFSRLHLNLDVRNLAFYFSRDWKQLMRRVCEILIRYSALNNEISLIVWSNFSAACFKGLFPWISIRNHSYRRDVDMRTSTSLFVCYLFHIASMVEACIPSSFSRPTRGGKI